jgi:hypothetical protein
MKILNTDNQSQLNFHFVRVEFGRGMKNSEQASFWRKQRKDKSSCRRTWTSIPFVMVSKFPQKKQANHPLQRWFLKSTKKWTYFAQTTSTQLHAKSKITLYTVRPQLSAWSQYSTQCYQINITSLFLNVLYSGVIKIAGWHWRRER